MSSDLRAAVLDLTTAVRQLTSATQSLASALETPRLGSCTSDFVISIIKDSYILPELEEVSGLLSVRGAEEGPPDVPECIYKLSETKLFYISGDTAARAKFAFNLGFWAKVALDTSTPYECDTHFGIVVSHWVVLRSPFKVPFRLDNLPDFRRFVGEDNKEAIYQTFQTLCEVEIFCCGANLPVPPLWRSGRRD